MDELFEIPQSKSPRLQWMHRHWIKLEEKDGKYRAVQGLVNFAYRDSEDLALTHAAVMLGIRLWNEETITNKPQ